MLSVKEQLRWVWVGVDWWGDRMKHAQPNLDLDKKELFSGTHAPQH